MNRVALLTMALLTACGPATGTYTLSWDGGIDGMPTSGSRTWSLTGGDQGLVESLPDPAFGTMCPPQLPCFSTAALGLPKKDGDPAGAPVVVVQPFGMMPVPLVGKNQTRAFFTAGGSVETGVVSITKVVATGRAVDPIEIHGSIDTTFRSVGRLDGKRRELQLTGDFLLYPSCEGSSGFQVQFPCSYRLGSITEAVEQTDFYGKSKVSVPWFFGGLGEPDECPGGLFSQFVDGDVAEYSKGSLKIGKGRPFTCNSHFCYVTAYRVEAGGCTWSVNAFAQVGAATISNPNTSAKPETTRVFISAEADRNCASPVKYCQARQ